MSLSKADQIAWNTIGGLSEPSKMPGRAFSLPAAGAACPIGSQLVKVPGTVCHGCYALKGNYRWPHVRTALETRFRLVQEALADPDKRIQWLNAMVQLAGKEPWFRWHDSGDVFSLAYLELIVDVAKGTPFTRHWLPTREMLTVKRYQDTHGAFPENLIVRLSLQLIDPPEGAIRGMAKAFGLPLSMVSRNGYTCPAPTQGNNCGECRRCWSPNVGLVTYKKH